MNTAWLQTLMAGPASLTGTSIANNSAHASHSLQRASRNAASSNTYGIQPDVVASIKQASVSTGVDFSFLMAQAARESSFDPNAKAKTSTAHGLYQFVEQTWMSVFKDHGAEYGYGNLASQIKTNSDGRMVVKDPAVRKEILNLRRDPQLSSQMAAEHAADNQAKMEKKLGRDVTGTDLYLAHFLGVQGALKFLRNMKSDPSMAAADIFPSAADANSKVFYKADGTPKSLSEVYNNFGKKINADMAAYRDLNVPMDASNLAQLQTKNPATQLAQLFNSDGDDRHGALAGNRAVFGQTNPGGVLSPVMLMTLAGLPTADEADSDSRSSDSHQKQRWLQGGVASLVG
ncbi:MAG: lytic transglycosylase domain-containing protein [Rhodospirillaceae bacterium]|nr:MAG: lytic transglycosylase domain-containing protein [Rhodospirillaceae bacterium]